jgi:hypothetical protein
MLLNLVFDEVALFVTQEAAGSSPVRPATKCPIRNEIEHFCCDGFHALEQVAW